MNQVDNAVKQQIIGEYIKTAAGRAKLAASMIQPLRLRRDYTAVGRKTFLVEQLPDGAVHFTSSKFPTRSPGPRRARSAGTARNSVSDQRCFSIPWISSSSGRTSDTDSWL